MSFIIFKRNHRKHLQKRFLRDDKALELLLLFDSLVRNLLKRRIISSQDRPSCPSERKHGEIQSAITVHRLPSRRKSLRPSEDRCTSGTHNGAQRLRPRRAQTSARIRVYLEKLFENESRGVEVSTYLPDDRSPRVPTSLTFLKVVRGPIILHRPMIA